MVKKIEFTKSQIEEIAQRYKEGETPAQIANSASFANEQHMSLILEFYYTVMQSSSSSKICIVAPMQKKLNTRYRA